MAATKAHLLADLRRRLDRIGGSTRHDRLAFCPAEIARHVGSGLAAGLHEVVEAGPAALLFVASVLVASDGPVLWCHEGRGLFAAGLASVGLHPDRVIHAEAGDDRTRLACMEEALRHGGLAGAVGLVHRLSATAARRLQLAAETAGSHAFLLRRGVEEQRSACITRWRITPVPSAPLPVQGVGPMRWRVELLRCRGAEPAEWIVEVGDGEDRLALAAVLADGSAAPAAGPRRAAG